MTDSTRCGRALEGRPTRRCSPENLTKEIHPVEIPATRKEPARTIEHDESIRGDTTAEKLVWRRGAVEWM